jgi:hypothetical protein
MAALEALASPTLGLRRDHHLLVFLNGCRTYCNEGGRAFAGVLRDVKARKRAEILASGRRNLSASEERLVRKMERMTPWIEERLAVLEVRRARLDAAITWIEKAVAAGASGSVAPFTYRDMRGAPRSEEMQETDAGLWLLARLRDQVKQAQIAAIAELGAAERRYGVDPFAVGDVVPEAVRTLRLKREIYSRAEGVATSAGIIEAMQRHPVPEAVRGLDDISVDKLLVKFRAERDGLCEQERLARASWNLAEKLRPYDIERYCILNISSGNTILTATRNRYLGGDQGLAAASAMEWAWTVGPLLSQGLERLTSAANRLAGGDEPTFDFVDSVTFDASRERQVTTIIEYPDEMDAAQGGVSPYMLMTGNDPRPNGLCPGDRVPHDAGSILNLRAQARTVGLALAHGLRNPGLFPAAEKNTPRIVNVRGRVVTRDARSGPFPRLPLSGALVILPSFGPFRAQVFTYRYAISDADGDYSFPAAPAGYIPDIYGDPARNMDMQLDLLAFGVSGDTGKLEYAPDGAMSASGGYSTGVSLHGGDVFRRLVVFRGAPVQFYGVQDPLTLGFMNEMKLLDGKGAGLDSWYVTPPQGVSQSDMLVGLAPAGGKMKFLFSLQGNKRLLLLGNDADNPTGSGYEVGMGLNQTDTVPRAAEDIWQLNDARLARLENKGVKVNVARRLHDEATRGLSAMRKAFEEKRYSFGVYEARNAWGRALRAYPEIIGKANEAVVALVLLLFLLAPWAFFMERVTLQSGTVYGRILGSLGYFTAAFAFLFWLHPAFQISTAPMIILVAYVLEVLALLALSVILGKYGAVMREWRERVGGVHTSDISRASAFAVAFSLGLTNLAKRPLRTTLTILTVALLSFSVMTFTSVDTFLDTRFVEIPGSKEDAPKRDAVMYRCYQWGMILGECATAFEQDLGPGAEYTRRSWMANAWDPWNAGLGLNVFGFMRPDTGALFNAEILQGLMPQERLFSELSDCVTGAWFTGADDEIILPTKAAKSLGIGAAKVIGVPPEEQVRVRFGQKLLRVIGILDSSRADRLRDTSGGRMSPIDIYACGFVWDYANPQPKLMGSETGVRYMEFDRVVLLPHVYVGQLGGMTYSVLGRFGHGLDSRKALETLMSRLDVNLFASLEGARYLVKTATAQSVSGLWKTVMPVLLVVLIMVNTMMGTVEERQGEILMLGAVGLAPRHVGILYLAEACVYGVLGVVFGVTFGLTTAWVTRGVEMGVNVNYASVPTMLMGGLVLLIVVLATIIPARRAARMATPSGAGKWTLAPLRAGLVHLTLPFSLTRENGVGVLAFLHEYLDGHWESTSPDFRCAELRTDIEGEGDETRLIIRGRVWLAPYDMRVSQEVAISLREKDGLGLFAVDYHAEKQTGEESAWQGAGYDFIDRLRQQFLIYRTLRDGMKSEYVARAARVFGKA